MKRINHLILLFSFILTLSSLNTFSQDRVPELNKGTIETQFNELIEKSGRYQDYKVIRAPWLSTLKSHVSDTITQLKKQLNNAIKLATANQTRIDSLKSQLESTSSELNATHKEKDSIPFLFFNMDKSSYNRMVWALIGLLVIALLIFIFLYKRSKGTINTAKADLEEKKQEFEAFRKRALERESQLSRNYLNELNKYRNK